ncbi:dolichol-phosphate mannosyltransferase [Actimicrobium sp. GrIS 1.19]|uniref:glycosyltransferase n=1 Tax=Actimicrobium sp. GrIS 1.19 TaxID=3071708 RepID=UPI002E08BACE|nr:dolichol-phosphate mannosyltransferase [Actimicrobium sp. GrIS 1.19]
MTSTVSAPDHCVPGRIAVVIPAFRVRNHILDVLAAIGPEVWRIYVIDDKCPDRSGDFAEQNCSDSRMRILRHAENLGVGGAVMTGYQAAIRDGAEVIVKIDGDGQMDPSLIANFAGPILGGEADYTKGNRFFDLEEIRSMPPIRLFGNAALSLMTKFSSGYWDLFDPTNGYTAIHADVAQHLPFKRISQRYFFETDMLFRLNTLRAVVIDIPMNAQYGDEVSNLKISKIISEFIFKHSRNFLKRIFYNYYLRDLTMASIQLPIGLVLFICGLGYGVYHWSLAAETGLPTPIGTVMLSALSILVGMQFLLTFLSYDIGNIPRRTLHSRLRLRKIRAEVGLLKKEDAE